MIHLKNGTRMMSGLVGGEAPSTGLTNPMGSWVMGNDDLHGRRYLIETQPSAGEMPAIFQEPKVLFRHDCLALRKPGDNPDRYRFRL